MLHDDIAVLRAVMARCCPDIPCEEWHFFPVEGLSGVNWRAINRDGVTFLLRPQNAHKRRLGISRRRELGVLHRLTGQGLAPAARGIWYGWLVCDWLTGEISAVLPDTESLAALLVQVHRNVLLQPRVDLRHQYEIYWQALDRRRIISAMLRRHQRMLRQPEPRTHQLALLHMDIHPANLVATNTGWQLIDWEYAGGGDVALELAALVRGNDWHDDNCRMLVAHYCRYAGGAENVLRQRIKQWIPRIDYLMWLWYEVRWRQTADVRFKKMATQMWQRLD